MGEESFHKRGSVGSAWGNHQLPGQKPSLCSLKEYFLNLQELLYPRPYIEHCVNPRLWIGRELRAHRFREVDTEANRWTVSTLGYLLESGDLYIKILEDSLPNEYRRQYKRQPGNECDHKQGSHGCEKKRPDSYGYLLNRGLADLTGDE